MDQILNPQFIAELAVLITAITGLIVALRTQSTTRVIHDTTNTIQENTNGTLQAVQQKLAAAQNRIPGHSRATDPPTNPPTDATEG